MSRVLVALAAIAVLAGVAGAERQEAGYAVGSKVFNESVILGEMIAQLGRGAGFDVSHRRQLGGSSVLFQALRAGEIDAYPEYTGTLRRELLSGLAIDSDAGLASALAERGVRMAWPLGFNNTYAIVMREESAAELGIETISDLRDHPGLRVGFTSEFMDRADGWPALREAYRLPQRDVSGMQHELAYRGLRSGSLDVVDAYSTDAEVGLYDLRVLEDDGAFFPTYEAVILYRTALEAEAPEWVRAMHQLSGAVGEDAMIEMNRRAREETTDEGVIAGDFLRERTGFDAAVRERSGRWGRIWKTTREHTLLVAIPMLGGVLVAIPLGIVAASSPRAGQVVLAVVGIAQTIPSLALLALFVPVLGIGQPPALVALFVYSLLPMVRGTQSGLASIPPGLAESAHALGIGPVERLRLIELPLASRSIMSGVKTSLVILIGFATLGAFIGAGGYGDPILTGIRRDDVGLILEGALPAAGMALAAQGLFGVLDRVLVPRGLRLKTG